MMVLDMKRKMHFTEVFMVRLMCRCFTFGLILGLCSIANADTSPLWKTADKTEFETQARKLTNSDLNSTRSNHSFENAEVMTLNEDLMRELLKLDSSTRSSSNHDGTELEIGAKGGSTNEYDIQLPLPNGTIIDLTLVKDSVLPKKLAEKYPEINTYRVLSNDKIFGGKVDISPSGFHAMLQMLNGEIIFIDPTELSKSEYAIYNKSTQITEDHRKHSCGLDTKQTANTEFDTSGLLSSPIISSRETVQQSAIELASRNQDSLKNYTIAIATTGEYSAKFGGSVGATMAAITTSLNRVNQILERDLGIHLNLAENNDLLINTDASSDPYDKSTMLDLVLQNQEFIDNIIGNTNYDIGHLFTTSGGGLAAIASICNNDNKAKGASGITSPRGDSFDLDFVAHEIGHQLGATHTFNSTQGACSAETRTARSAFEPGSGSSIMSYAGYCGLDNIQSNTDAMYHIGSIQQIADYTNFGVGSRCGVVTTTENTPPQVNAGRDYTIPARTPFELTGSATDSDGDPLLYAWEQLDAGDTSTENLDKGNNALFRVHSPSSTKFRSFPPLNNIVNNTQAKGETLPSYKRNLTMSFVAQDSFNIAQSDEMKINVARTGSRFALNYPRAHYTRGSTYPIYWNVADTDKAPVNCSTVNIFLSLDGGQNFNQSVATNIINNGETLITIPADAATSAQGRFKVKCSDNIFFAISHRNFFVTQYDDSVSIQYPNEDKPETSLKDLPLNSSPDTGGSSVISSSNESFSSGSGGGVFNFMIYILMLILVFKKESTMHIITKN
jgi:hypothetical protein